MTRLTHSLLAVVLCFSLSTSALPTGDGQAPSNTLDDQATAQGAYPVPRVCIDLPIQRHKQFLTTAVRNRDDGR